jgi:acetyl esterase/lipase
MPERPGYPALDDLKGWAESVKQSDAIMAGMRLDAAAAPHVTGEAIMLGKVPSYRIALHARPADDAGNILFDIHGGALIAGGGDLCRVTGSMMALAYGVTTYAPDYRMPPRFRYPAALDDCVDAYRALLALHPAKRIVVQGSSAGGNLAAALMLRLRDEGLAFPAGLILQSPEVDLTESGDSFKTNLGVDTMLRRPLMPVNLLYAGGHDLADPMLSPLFGDFTKGFPPTVLTSGTRDLFLSNAVRMHRALRKAGIESDLILSEAMPHGGFFGAPEDVQLLAELRQAAGRFWKRG